MIFVQYHFCQNNSLSKEREKGKYIISTVYDLKHGKCYTDNFSTIFDLEIYAMFFSIQFLKLATRVYMVYIFGLQSCRSYPKLTNPSSSQERLESVCSSPKVSWESAEGERMIPPVSEGQIIDGLSGCCRPHSMLSVILIGTPCLPYCFSHFTTSATSISPVRTDSESVCVLCWPDTGQPVRMACFVVISPPCRRGRQTGDTYSLIRALSTSFRMATSESKTCGS